MKKVSHICSSWMRSLQALLSILFSFEMIFVVFIFAGVFKSDPRFDWIPVDLTLLTMGVGFLLGMWILLVRKGLVLRESMLLTLIYVCIAAYALLSLLWSPSIVYADDKVIRMLSLVMWSLIGSSWIIAYDPQRVTRFIYALGLFSFWFAYEGLKTYLTSDGSGFINVMGGTYLGAGQIMGLGAIVFLSFILFHPSSMLYRLLSLIGLAICMFQLFVGGGRGPLLAVLAAMLVPLLYGIQLKQKGLQMKKYVVLVLALLMVVAAITVVWSASPNPPQTLQRMTDLLPGKEDMGASAEVRVSNIEESSTYWNLHPLRGSGIGAWPILSKMDDYREYPHNLVLEVAVELGSVGILLLLILFSIVVRYVWLLRHIPHMERWMVLIMLTVAMMFNVTVSGDLPDNRALFAIMGLLPVIVVVQRKEVRSDGGLSRPHLS